MAEVALRDYLNEIDSLIDHGSIEAALQHSRHILLQYPKAIEVYRLMGKALLEREDDRAAQDVFQRVLSVDPEDFVARVGLSIVHDRNNEVDQAIWHMERAFDIAPSNALIQGELRRLYVRRDGAPPDRIPLTRDALARMYAQGDLNAEAIADLRELLREQPDRIDLQVEMAEVLWRDEQRVDASELTLKVLNTLPYCLKANLIIGAILRDSGANGESAEPFQRAQSVDPENIFAAAFFGGQGPLVQQPVLVDRLDLQTVSDMLESEELVEQAEDVPEWLRGVSDLEQSLLPESELEHAPRLAAGLHMPDVATEIPDWLQGLTTEPSTAEADVPDWLAALTGAAVAGAAAYALTDREKAESEELAVVPTDEETPDWISQLGSTGTLTAPETIPPVVEDEQPDWMAQLRETPPAPYSETIPVSEDSETPDWLAALAGAAVAGAAAQALTKGEEEAAPEEPGVTPPDEVVLGTVSQVEEDEQPAWMAQLRETPPAPYSETIPVSEDSQTPDWLAALAGAAVAGAAAQALTEGEEEAVPEAPGVTPADEVVLGTIPPAVEDEQPAWMAQLRETPPAPYSETIPVSEDSETPDWLAALAGVAVAGAAAQALTEGEEEAAPEGTGVTPTDEVVLGTIPPAEEDEQPAWMAQMRETPPAPYSETIPVSEDSQTPDWLAEIQASVPPLEETPAGEEPDWLTQLRASRGEVAPEPESSSLDLGKAAAGAVGLAGLAGAALFVGREGEDEEVAAELEVPVPATVEPMPEVSFGIAEPVAAPEVPDEMPSADDALAFLAKLAAGKEDQLRAEAKEEADLRMDAIMGRKPAEPKSAEPAQKGQPAIRLATTGAAAAGLVAAATKLKNKLEEPEEPEQPTPSVAAVEPPLEVPEEMPSSDDALAFLAKLAAGKEVQLQAEAQREADVRMAAIMGRKPVELAAEPVAQIPSPVEPAAPVAATAEVPEEMPSADDALAFLAKLAAGKEDQLRAEAKEEADLRMDAIMGRKPAVKPAPEDKPGAGLAAAAAIGAAAAVGVAATKKEEPTPPPEVPETMPSADDALAFLARLAAGKEDQLRAQAEQEAEVRMAAIMGRSAPLEPVKTIEPETPPTLEVEIESAEESTEWLADLSATAEPVPASELPDWLREMRPSDETVVAEPASELPEWLRAMRPDESVSTPGLAALFEEEAETELEAAVPAAELPDWLRSMQPGAVTGGLTLESLTIEDEEIEAAATPTSELPDWLRSIRPTEPALELEETVEEEETSLPLGALAGAAALGLAATLGSEESVSAELEPSTEELLAELAALEQAASVAEIEPAQASIVLSHDWWAQAAEDTDEEPLQELPDLFLSPRARAAEKERGRAAVATEKPKSEPSALPQTGPLHAVQTGPLPQTGPLVMPESLAPSPEVEALVARVSGDQKNYAARLELARTYWATGNREGAYTEYLELTNAGEYTKELMSDLGTIVEINDLPDWHRMLGDVCMKAGKLPQALAHYRQALNTL